MIASLRGKLELLGSDAVIINVGGIGLRVHVPTTALSTFSTIGEEIKLFTHFHLREDNMALYGFITMDELKLFQVLISVSGLGPRLALTMLSTMRVEQLTMAIATSSVELLTQIPGIGKKMANRLLLEIRDKIDTHWVTPAGDLTQENMEVIAALTYLGYSVAEAHSAVATLTPSDELNLEDKIRLALQYFSTD